MGQAAARTVIPRSELRGTLVAGDCRRGRVSLVGQSGFALNLQRTHALFGCRRTAYGVPDASGTTSVTWTAELRQPTRSRRRTTGLESASVVSSRFAAPAFLQCRARSEPLAG
jgi:hypothetical protein